MAKTNISEFLYVNKLKQIDLAKYLGISDAAASMVANGKSGLSKTNLLRLINNDKGWDTSMLLENDNSPSITTHATGHSNASVSINSHNRTNSNEKDTEIAVLKERIANLEKLLEEEKQRSAQYWEMIQKLMK